MLALSVDSEVTHVRSSSASFGPYGYGAIRTQSPLTAFRELLFQRSIVGLSETLLTELGDAVEMQHRKEVPALVLHSEWRSAHHEREQKRKEVRDDDDEKRVIASLETAELSNSLSENGFRTGRVHRPKPGWVDARFQRVGDHLNRMRGIYHGVDDVRKDVADEHQQAADDQNAERDRVVSLKDRRITEIPHPVDVEDLLNQKRAGENQAEDVAQAGGNRNQRVAKRMDEDHPPSCEALSRMLSARNPAT